MATMLSTYTGYRSDPEGDLDRLLASVGRGTPEVNGTAASGSGPA